jgi:serine protease Do
MKTRLTILIAGAALVLGLVIGSTFDPFPLASTVAANPLTARQVSDVYDRLGTAPNPLLEGSRVLAEIARITTPAVVHIQSERRTRNGGRVEETGSGVIVESARAPGKYVVTNRHVVHDYSYEDISIHLYDGRVVHPTRILTDAGTDVAIMKIEAGGLQPVLWGDSDEVEIGHMVLALGSPFGLSQSVTYGIISAKGRRSLSLGASGAMTNQEFLQTDAAINPGNSGGPLIDLRGRLVGINTAIASNSGGNEGIAFSIPSNLVRQITEQLLEHGTVKRAFLGVKLDPDLTTATAARLKLDRVRGARIVEVYEGTPAAQAKLRPDDVVLRMNGTEVIDHDHLINLVSLTAVGKEIELTILRGGRTVTARVLLSDRKEPPAQ